MDEVKAMTQAGETVGRTVGTGLRTLRRGAVQVGQAGAEAAARAATVAEQRLAAGADTVRDATSDAQAEFVKTTRKARKQLARDAQQARKQTNKNLSKSAKRARKHAGKAARDARGTANDLMVNAGRAVGRQPKRSRKWPWLLGIVVVAVGAGAAYAMKDKQQQDTTPSRPDELAERDRSATNGTAPKPRLEQPADSQANHKS